MMNRAEQMRLFLEPRSVALVGARRQVGKGSFNALENLLNQGFPGEIYPVNPHAEEILGQKVYHKVKCLPRGIDLAVVMVPREAVLQAVEECLGRGIKALIVVSQGFAEADNRGRELQAALELMAKEAGARVVGPNSFGVINAFRRFSTTLLPSPRDQVPVALVSQSGGLLEGFWGFSFGKAVDLGNMCDVDFADVLGYLESDPETRVIALHMEGVGDGRRFIEVAQLVSQKKPVLVLKPGKSGKALQAVASHTGSLAGVDLVYQAAFRKCGLIRAENVEELGDFARGFLQLPPLKGNRLAIVTPTGAGAIMAMDAMEEQGFALAELSAETVSRIGEFFPPWAPPSNPVDMLFAGMAHGYGRIYRVSLEAVLDDENVDGVLCIAGSPSLKSIKGIAEGRSKPVAVWLQGGLDEEVLARIKESGYQAVFPSPERAIKALAALRDYSETSVIRGTPCSVPF
ncbi:MAG: CoA-binding protein [Dehalococcoidia bacterium]|nr:CoA-binding protein [Dehalococcoidia bacterium]